MSHLPDWLHKNEPQIRSMSPGELETVCEVIGLAFADNPSTLANVRGDRAKARQVMREAVRVAKFGRTWSHALVALDGGKVVGALNAAQWPHCQPGTLEKIRTAPSMLRIMKGALPRAFTMMTRREAHDPHEPHWHIGPVGVIPELQGQGIGTTLLELFLSSTDATGSPTFLETDVDRNVALYENLGFEVVAQEDIIGVSTRFMWRDATKRPA
jgi:ribosomal protein S18 acetylase RimI-like enzyme